MGAHRHVPGSDALGEGQADGKVGRNADFPGGQVGVRGDHGARGKIDALAHHVLPKQALLLLQLLPYPLPVRIVQSAPWTLAKQSCGGETTASI